MNIPKAAEYKAALSILKITPIQRKMLEAHYRVRAPRHRDRLFHAIVISHSTAS